MPEARPKKSLGQCFLVDPLVVSRILGILDPQVDDFILEIGPGSGALSIPLAARVGRLHAVEIDAALARGLEVREPRMTVHCADILGFDLESLPVERIRVLGNLPYNIGTPILFHLMGFRECIVDMLLMLQREVAERICAPAGAAARGRLSVMCQTFFDARECFQIPPEAFDPAPKVYSSLLALRPETRWIGQIESLPRYQRVVRAAFSQPRKTLRNALRGICGSEGIEGAGIDPNARPAALDISAFIRLSNHLR